MVANLFAATGEGCTDPSTGAVSNSDSTLPPGYRNEFHAGLQQAFGKYLVVDGEYIWKYTHNAYDFSVLGNTPITFPIAWNNSKIPGFAIRASVPNYHGFTALVVMSSVAARFFTPQIGGVGAVPIDRENFRRFASTTTRNSTRPRTCNINRSSAARGSASTGVTTAASSPVRAVRGGKLRKRPSRQRYGG